MIQGAADTTPPCNADHTALSPTSQNVGAAGGTGSTAVSTNTVCVWSAVSNAPWITVTSGANGVGNGSVAFSIAANTGVARTGTIAIAGHVFTVMQAAAASPQCTYTIAPANQNFPVLGGSGTVTVTAVGSSCSWTAASSAAWITVTSGATGNGNGSVGFTVAANLGAARTGTLAIAGHLFTVTQNAVLGGLVR